ncbi:hypothetical protein B0H34DRAFT_700499 [Crassisporium funariophilum]|nr:hypothetical protein B0H34DRAFT_700499 [Crassisporium funariophilum]
MQFQRLLFLASFYVLALPSVLSTPTPIEAGVQPIAMQISKLAVEEQVSNTTASYNYNTTSTSSSPEGLSMMTPWSMGILTAGGLFVTLL